MPAEPRPLTHLDEHGAARMVDVSGKDVSTRTASATGRFLTTSQVVGLLRRDGLPKGDALAVARIAGIAAAKRTPDLVPLCHPVALHGVSVDLQLGPSWVDITATTRTADRTGVEMEALTSVVAGRPGALRHGQGGRPCSGTDRRPAARQVRRPLGRVDPLRGR